MAKHGKDEYVYVVSVDYGDNDRLALAYKKSYECIHDCEVLSTYKTLAGAIEFIELYMRENFEDHFLDSDRTFDELQVYEADDFLRKYSLGGILVSISVFPYRE